MEAITNAIIQRDYMDLGSEIYIDMYDDRMEIYSPGGMMDGKRIQNLNLFHVPSKRRNPLLADFFNRLDLMERRGSGVKKITMPISSMNICQPNLSARSVVHLIYNLYICKRKVPRKQWQCHRLRE